MTDPTRLRSRRPLVVPEESSHPVFDKPIFKQFAKLDLYPKPASEAIRRTAAGGFVSVIAAIFISWLLLAETYHYLIGTDAYEDQLMVDVGIGEPVPINFNITFYAVQCTDLHLDVMDASGSQQNNVATDLYKSPVDWSGKPLYKGFYNYVPHAATGLEGEEHVYDPKTDPTSKDFCGKCYIQPRSHDHGLDRPGGIVDHHLTEHHKGQCCNTCEEVMAMYDKHRIPRPHMEEVEQCLHEMFIKNPGCNVRGTVYVQKVKGNFHFAPGQSLEHSGMGGFRMGGQGHHIHAYNPATVARFNTSHKIVHLSFGPSNVRRLNKRGVVFPLDGKNFIIPRSSPESEQGDDLALVKYFINVVPTVYQRGNTRTESAYEFSSSSHHSTFSSRDKGHAPGAFFVYDFHPIQIVHIFRRAPFGHYLVKISGITGGLFVVSGMLDACIHFFSSVKRRIIPTPDAPTM